MSELVFFILNYVEPCNFGWDNYVLSVSVLLWFLLLISVVSTSGEFVCNWCVLLCFTALPLSRPGPRYSIPINIDRQKAKPPNSSGKKYHFESSFPENINM